MGTAQALLVFGRGVMTTGDGGGWTLTPGGFARLRAAVEYVETHGGRPRVIFTGAGSKTSGLPRSLRSVSTAMKSGQRQKSRMPFSSLGTARM